MMCSGGWNGACGASISNGWRRAWQRRRARRQVAPQDLLRYRWLGSRWRTRGGARAWRLAWRGSALRCLPEGRMGGGMGCSCGPHIPARQAARLRHLGQGVTGLGGQAARVLSVCHQFAASAVVVERLTAGGGGQGCGGSCPLPSGRRGYARCMVVETVQLRAELPVCRCLVLPPGI